MGATLGNVLAQAHYIFAAIKNKYAMLEVIISVTLYATAIVLLVKGVIAFCNYSGRDMVSESRSRQ